MSVSGATEIFKILGQGKVGKIYITIIIALAIAIFFQILITRTKYGRSVFAIGGNPETARLAGIPVKRENEKFILWFPYSLHWLEC